jgi:hypothetical protein
MHNFYSKQLSKVYGDAFQLPVAIAHRVGSVRVGFRFAANIFWFRHRGTFGQIIGRSNMMRSFGHDAFLYDIPQIGMTVTLYKPD